MSYELLRLRGQNALLQAALALHIEFLAYMQFALLGQSKAAEEILRRNQIPSTDEKISSYFSEMVNQAIKEALSAPQSLESLQLKEAKAQFIKMQQEAGVWRQRAIDWECQLKQAREKLAAAKLDAYPEAEERDSLLELRNEPRK